MKLQELEEYIHLHYTELYEECRGFCKESDAGGVIRLQELRLYEGCIYCIVRTAVDHLNVPTIIIPLKNGRTMELVRLSDYILEFSEEFVQVFDVENFMGELTDYLEFGLLSDDEISLIREWLLGQERT